MNDRVKTYVLGEIDEHRATYNDGEIRDFIDLYIKSEKDEAKEVDSRSHLYLLQMTSVAMTKSFISILTGVGLIITIGDLFKAGSDTVSASLTWCIQYLIKYPELQDDIHQEIINVRNNLWAI